jgi:hypothetical protein
VTPLGKKKLTSIVMVGDKGDLSEVDPKNITMLSLDDLPDDARKLYEKQKKIREQEELQMFLTSFKKDQQDVVTQVKEIALPPIKDKKVMADKLNILDSDVANAIDCAVSASLNNKFAAASQDLEKMLATHQSQMESKFSKFFDNNIHASTSNTGKQISCAGGDTSTLQIPKFPPPPEPSIENMHSRTVIGNSARVGCFVPPYYASAYSTPAPQTIDI